MKTGFNLIYILFLYNSLFAQSYDSVRMLRNPEAEKIINESLLHRERVSKNSSESTRQYGFSVSQEQKMQTGWSNKFTVPGVSGGSIYAMTTDGTNLYIGGQFSVVGGTVANNIAKWDGSQWSSIGVGAGNGVDFSVEALAFADGKLFVGGSFSRAGNLKTNSVAYWDGSDWHSLGEGDTNGVRTISDFGNGETLIHSGHVHTLSLYKDFLMIGGLFHLVGEKNRTSGIAGWNIKTNKWETFNGGVTNADSFDKLSYGYAFATNGNDLYVGGKFDSAGGVPARGIARWDGNGWYSLGEGVNERVFDIEFDHSGNLYACGFFNSAGSKKASGIAMWNGAEWFPLGDDSFVEDESYLPNLKNICITDNRVYVGGYFEKVGSKKASSLAIWTGDEWFLPSDSLQALVRSFTGSINAIQKINDKIYIGGNFARVNNTIAGNLAVLDINTFKLERIIDNSQLLGITDGFVGVIENAGEEFYIGGDFAYAGDVKVNNIAKWNGSNWESLGSGYYNGIEGNVYSILVDGTDVYVGGRFRWAGQTESNGIAKWDGNQWSPLGLGVTGVPGASVFSIIKIGEFLYAGGLFAFVGDLTNGYIPANSIARYNLNTGLWEALDIGVEIIDDYPGIVNVLEFDGNTIYVGGRFDYARKIPTHNIAVYTDGKWDSFGTTEDNGVYGTVFDIKVIDKEVYVGGRFIRPGTDNSTSFIKWDGNIWKDIAGGVSASDGYTVVTSIQSYEDQLIVGGLFDKAAEKNVSNIALLRNGKWEDFEGGINGPVSVITPNGNNINAGGWFTVAGGIPSVSLAQYKFMPTSLNQTNNNLPVVYQIEQNFPNPFNPITNIRYYISTKSNLNIRVYNSIGQEVTNLFSGSIDRGVHNISWDASKFSSGIYYCRFDFTAASVQHGAFSKTIKLALIK
ncbi:MAG: T9SS type A sorting domain-containing protein [Bacteroidetes bacterium]|nr:T9SS type A sorting domain-containing protein [Bacteroidota bacterium]